MIKDRLKEYNELSEGEKHIIREYQSWAKSACVEEYKIEMLTNWRKRAADVGISHLL